MTGHSATAKAVASGRAAGVDDLLHRMRLTRADAVILVFHRSAMTDARSIHRAVRRDHGCRVALVPILAAADPTLSVRLRQAVAESGEDRVVLLTLEDTPLPDEDVTPHLGRAEIIRVLGYRPGLLPALCHVGAVSEASHAVAAALGGARTATVRTGGGQSLTIAFEPGTRWAVNDGLPKPGEVTVLPGGEVSASPSLVDGTFQADGVVHANRPLRRDVRLFRSPVTLRVQDGTVQEVNSDDLWLARFLGRAIRLDGVGRVTRVAVGTNSGAPPFLDRPSPLNLRHPGFRLRLGGRAEAGLRLDLVATRPLAEVGGRTIDLTALIADASSQDTAGEMTA